MQLQQRINAFVKLGDKIGALLQGMAGGNCPEIFKLAEAQNGWFTPDNIAFSMEGWIRQLQADKMVNWLSHYPALAKGAPKTIGVVMAGNIPLVGFHDFLSVLMVGHRIKARVSSKDKVLLPYLARQLIEIEPEFDGYIEISEDKLDEFDAIIATGSNNTARYFDHYFGKYPNLIRRNRNSVAVLNGTETAEELSGLASDIFRYYGLGCRNVSKLYLPEGYDFTLLFESLLEWKELINQTKYINNYDYNKAVYLMSNIKLLDNEFVLLKEDKGLSSPIGVVYYQQYSTPDQLKAVLEAHKGEIQVVVSRNWPGAVPFGQTQMPELADYADGVDTMEFLHGL